VGTVRAVGIGRDGAARPSALLAVLRTPRARHTGRSAEPGRLRAARDGSCFRLWSISNARGGSRVARHLLRTRGAPPPSANGRSAGRTDLPRTEAAAPSPIRPPRRCRNVTNRLE